ncbi:AAA family ATPase [Novispirillum sp. DQ9]|uniref:AAA family ATPase n=1 Tax=Novispirillum sp. DQ9 TaxID=3398612 RepID=UPI003C7D0CF9
MRISIVAFTETDDRANAVRVMATDRRLRRCTVAVQDGGLEAAARHLALGTSPDLLILETHLDGDRLMQALDALAGAVAPTTRVVILGQGNDIALYRALLGMGVSEYLVGAIDAGELAGIADAIFNAEGSGNTGRVVAVFGARGGVGTSAVATNLAVALGREMAEDVLLVDLDLAFGSDALALNLNPRQTVQEALAQPDRLDDLLLDRFRVKVDDHLSLLGAPAILGDGAGEPTPEALDALFAVLRRNASHVVVDLPHQWSPWVREVLMDANEVVVVAYPDLANLRDARNLLERLSEPRGVQAPTRLVFNREGLARKGELAAKDFEEGAGARPVLSIPHDGPAFAAAMNTGEPVCAAAPNSPAAKAITELAWMVSGQSRADAKARARAKGKAGRGAGGFSLAGLFGGFGLTSGKA